MIAKALWHMDENESEIRSESLIAHDSHVQVKSKYSMISTGTERLIAMGKVPESLMNPMKVNYMSGNFYLPIKYGYSLVGESELDDGLIHLMHPHQDIFFADPAHLNKVPSSLDAQSATLVSNMETAINAVWDARMAGDEKVLVVGFGNIGALLCKTVELMKGIRPNVCEVDDYKKVKATELAWDLVDLSSEYDIVFNTSCTSAGLQLGLELLSFEGKLVELSWYGNQQISLKLGMEFHYKRLQIISSQVSHIPGHMTQEWDYNSRRNLGFQLLQNEYFKNLITTVVPFDDAPELFRKIRSGAHSKELITLLEY